MPIGALGFALVAAFAHVPPALRLAAVLAAVVPVLIWLRVPTLDGVERGLRSRWAPVLVGVLSAWAMAFTWTGLRHAPMLQDESAYLLQAHLFAAGRWADPAPPVPAFFEQPHVLVTPRFAAKYPPGHALLLTPGIWVRRPGLVPVLLLGLTAALLFSLAIHVLPAAIGPWAALLAWVGWLGMVGHEGWPRPSYMSEISTAALWMLGWWALLQWRDRRHSGYLLLLAVVVGWGAITRPLTMLAFAVPAAGVVLVLTRRRRAWRQLLAPALAGAAILALIPVWSWRTTGDWRQTPLGLYTRQYLPWDVPGLGFRATPPTRALPAEIACFVDIFGASRREYTLAALPGTLVTRATILAEDSFTDWRLGAAPFAVLALVALPVELAFALGTCVLLLLGYLAYAHDAGYTIYYMETQTTVAAVAALGLTAIVFSAARWWTRREGRKEAEANGRRVVAWCAVALCVLAIRPTFATLRGIRKGREIGDLPHRMFRDTVTALPDSRAIVFVRFRPGQGCGQNLIENTPPLASARTWVVYDRGLEDTALIDAAPDRVPYRFDATTWIRTRLHADSLVGEAAALERAKQPRAAADPIHRPPGTTGSR